MIFSKLNDPLDGERAVAVTPAPAPHIEAPWMRGRFTTGRTVTAPDLEQEQQRRSGREKLIGRALRPGVVHGLRATIAADGEGRPRRLAVAAGYGLCGSGEDVVVARPLIASAAALEIAIDRSLPVPSPAPGLPPSLADALAFWNENGPAPDGRTREALLPPSGDPPVPAFDVAALARLPFPAVLVVEPVVVEELAAAGDASDPCERDVEAEPFEDWRYTEAARLRLVPLSSWLDARGLDVGLWLNDALGPRRSLEAHRSGLAHALFELEAQSEERPPWELLQVALALVAFGPEGDVLWLDRAAVVRRGGRPRRPARAAQERALALRRARVDQLGEQLAEISASHAGRPLSRLLRKLPPAGLLPSAMFDLRARSTRALPASWRLTATPIPIDQLEGVIADASGLAALDLDAPGSDEVRLLVPVPTVYWDRALLQIASVHDDFPKAASSALARLEDAALRRGELRAKITALYAAVSGASGVPSFPADDEEAVLYERAALAVLWDSDPALAFVASLAAKPAPLLPDRNALLDASAALLHVGDLPPTPAAFNGTLVGRMRDAFETAGSSGPVLVIPGNDGEALELIAGAAIDVPATFALDVMANHAWDTVVERKIALYFVAHTLDTEALDRAVAASPRARIAVLAAEIDTRAREDLRWAYQRDPKRAPLVLVLTQGDLAARVASVRAAAAVLAGRAVPENEHLVRTATKLVASRERTVIYHKRGPTSAAALLVPAPADSPAGTPDPYRAAYAARTIRALQTWTSPVSSTAGADADANELLAASGAALELPFGTVPNSTGLGVAARNELKSVLAALITPGSGARVVSDAEIALLDRIGIAGLITVLEEKVERGDDVVDFGFMQVQAASFRAREFMLGRDAAQRTASSPLLAELADTIQSSTDSQQLQTFFENLKKNDDAGGGGGTPVADRWFKKALDLSVSREEAFRVGGLGGGGDIGRFELAVTADTRALAAPANGALPRARVNLTGGAEARVAVDFDFEAMREAMFADGAAVARAAANQKAGRKEVRSFSAEKFAAARNAMEAAAPVSWSLRTSGVATRVQDSKSLELRAEAFRLRGSITQTIFGLELNLANLPFPGFVVQVPNSLPRMEWLPLDDERVKQVLRGEHDTTTANADAPALVSDAVRSLETSAAMLRVVAGRVREVRQALAQCHRAQALCERSIVEAEAQHDALDGVLEEARQDLGVCRALLQEEEQRVADTNARRAAVLAERLPFLAYHRVREVELRSPAPAHDLEPALQVNPALAALQQPAPPAPDELRDAVDLWRDSPARWLEHVERKLPALDRFDLLRDTLLGSQRRALFALETPIVAQPLLAGLAGMPLIQGLVKTRRHALGAHRQPAAQLSESLLGRMSWTQAQSTARAVVSLADLLGHDVPPALSNAAARELENIYRVAASLYQELCLVAPRIRMSWAQRMSEFDRAVDLRDLSLLPGWLEVGAASPGAPADPFRQRELASLGGWLFGRVDEREFEAVSLMNDLVRICILLASHAPVGRIIAGHVEEEVPIEPGRVVPVRVDPRKVRVGMAALFEVAGSVRARGVIEDLSDGRAITRLLSTSVPGAMFARGDQIRFVESESSVAVQRATSGGQELVVERMITRSTARIVR